MASSRRVCTLLLLAAAFFCLSAYASAGDIVTTTFLSPAFELGPGEVHKKTWGPLPLPEGHIAINSFTAELVDAEGESIPLSELYLHHWLAFSVLVPDKKPSADDQSGDARVLEEERSWVKAADGSSIFSPTALASHLNGQLLGNGEVIGSDTPCNFEASRAGWGVGAETRRTHPEYPPPYGVEVGNPKKTPEGQKALLFSQIHAIDTRGAVNAKACIECRCDVFNATKTETGDALPEGYIGGLRCCYEGVKCQMKEGFKAPKRTIHLKYTIKYSLFDACVVPVRIFFLDVTDCKVEYNVPSCDSEGSLAGCVDTRTKSYIFPYSGRLIYAAGHQHVGATGIKAVGEKSGLLCDSSPIYGRGTEAGDEAGYVTGMGTCSMSSGVTVTKGEKVTVTATYSRLGGHTGVMSIFNLVLAVDGDYDAPPAGTCPHTENVMMTKNALMGEDASATWEERLGGGLEGAFQAEADQRWKLSLWGAVGGGLLGLAVGGMIGGIAFLLVKQQSVDGRYMALASSA
eukprot:TRINITY_DN4290_c0_g1_i1.p1 TRINITY_DN4290_c0_g1~~TRINITY_DN4290_c0_g1_i1.p1  ORF type:complete len:516 (+),score=84.10 TRINITY_DN4290_c0_g1_i1:240-1787(+)